MQLSALLFALPALLVAGDAVPTAAAAAVTSSSVEPTTTTVMTKTITLSKTLTLSKLHTVTSLCNTTIEVVPTPVGTTSYWTSPAVTTSAAAVKPTKGPHNAGASLEAGRVAIAGVLAAVAVAFL